ncbi:uncharacterized protein J3R85_016071 [Psidium guajava]|nr:uncharacterized protein J3R85_016071 [Psidium guajava]
MIALAATLSHLNFPWMSFLIALNIQHNGLLLRVHRCPGTLQCLVNMHGNLRTWNFASSKRLIFELHFIYLTASACLLHEAALVLDSCNVLL